MVKVALTFLTAYSSEKGACRVATLTTGIFEAPFRTVATVGRPDILCISLNNRSTSPSTVTVTVFRFRGGVGAPIMIFQERITLPPMGSHFRAVRGGYDALDTLRVDFQGDIQTDGSEITASVIGRRSSDGSFEPTMFFRHGDLVEVPQ